MKNVLALGEQGRILGTSVCPHSYPNFPPASLRSMRRKNSSGWPAWTEPELYQSLGLHELEIK